MNILDTSVIETEVNMNKKLLAIIKRNFEADSLTQKEIAAKCGMTESDLSLIWTGKRGLTIETFVKLCHGLQIKSWVIWKEACDDV